MSNIPFRVKLLTDTAKAPERANEGDLWDLFADGFCFNHLKDMNLTMYKSADGEHVDLRPMGRVLIKTGIALELPILWNYEYTDHLDERWLFEKNLEKCHEELAYAVADLRPRSGLALKHGITVLNAPATIDNSYRKEIGVILYNAGHESYTITKGDKICQMLIRPLYISSFEIVKHFQDTGRCGYGSTGK